ncbi:potassium channel family protein [Nakamurella leprariae]|uniref:Two pore domain potassium channel family protein n=1 Tax=Nakamurella leprariae TaxID=2803911 RepID=A0A938Y8P6_9ACTN|nr:potassium channel family protein [Nakamurella leprariae]MBM9466022.1 two pore domain potassium channel family protein [Nakamurella leprariae]
MTGTDGPPPLVPPWQATVGTAVRLLVGIAALLAGYWLVPVRHPRSGDLPWLLPALGIFVVVVGALYFSVTVFATVGFGDMTPESGAIRLLVSVQMLLNLVVLGVVFRVVAGRTGPSSPAGRVPGRSRPDEPSCPHRGTDGCAHRRRRVLILTAAPAAGP